MLCQQIAMFFRHSINQKRRPKKFQHHKSHTITCWRKKKLPLYQKRLVITWSSKPEVSNPKTLNRGRKRMIFQVMVSPSLQRATV